MKSICLKTILLLAPLTLWGQVVNSGPDLVDFSHPNAGCLENTECSKSMGETRLAWLKKMNLLKTPALSHGNNKELGLIVGQLGWPIEFYFKKIEKKIDNAMVFTPSCSKVQKLNFMGGISFVKKLSPRLTSADSSLEITFRPVWIYKKDQIMKFNLPIKEMPLYLKENEISFVTEIEEQYFLISTKTDGTFRVENANKILPTDSWSDKAEVECPQKLEVFPEPFQFSYCKKIKEMKNNHEYVMRIFSDCV